MTPLRTIALATAVALPLGVLIAQVVPRWEPTTRLEAQAGGPVDEAQLERLIFRAAAPIVQSVAPLTEAQRGELLPHIVRVMLAAFLEEHA